MQDAVSPTPAHQAQVQAAEQQQQEAALSQLDAAPLTAQQLQGLAIRQEDFEAAIMKVQPSVRREGFATTPDVSWEDVGALEEVCSFHRTCHAASWRLLYSCMTAAGLLKLRRAYASALLALHANAKHLQSQYGEHILCVRFGAVMYVRDDGS